MEAHKDNHILYLIIFATVILVFIGVLVFMSGKNKDNPSGGGLTAIAEPTLTPTIIRRKKGELSITLGNAQAKKMAGQNFDINIALNSPQAQLTSFDILLKFDKTKLSLVKNQAVIAGFSAVAVEDNEGIAITAFKAPSSKVIHNLDTVNLLNLTFKAMIKGKTSVEIVRERGKRTTKFVDNTSKIYYPEAGRVEIEIQ